MQNSDTAALTLSLEFFQSGMGLTLLLLIALLVLVCVLLTVLVVSSGATQRTLIAQLDSANKLLVYIHESLARTDNQLPARRRLMAAAEPTLPPARKTDPGVNAPRSVTSLDPGKPPARSARANPGPQAADRGNPGKRPVRSGPADGRTDVYKSTDAAEQDVLPARGARKDNRTDDSGRGGKPKRGGRAGDSTDIFTSVDI